MLFDSEHQRTHTPTQNQVITSYRVSYPPDLHAVNRFQLIYYIFELIWEAFAKHSLEDVERIIAAVMLQRMMPALLLAFGEAGDKLKEFLK